MFVNLHNHSCWSLLDGMSKTEDMVLKAKELNQPAIAITDHGTMAGVVEFYQVAKKHGIKPIIGVEVYTCNDVNVKDKNESLSHLVLLAKNLNGYKNLLKLVSESNNYFYYKPRVDINLLSQYSSDLVAMSACRAGVIPKAILNNDMDLAEQIAKQYASIFGDFYLELQYSNSTDQKKVNEGLLYLSRKLGLPLVVTCDSHYVNKDDAEAHDVLLAIQTKSVLSDPKRFRFDEPNYWIKSYDEIQAYNPPKEAIENTLVIADMCNVEIPLYQNLLPRFSDQDDDYLQQLAYDGLFDKYADGRINNLAEYKERLDFELDVIKQKGFSSYFLIVWDLISTAKSRGMFLGPARGSAGGSLLSYVIGITQIDPLKYNLLFHRFISLDRPTMPDIDIDIPPVAQAELMEYLDQKYGYTCRVGAYTTMASRGVLKDVARVLEIPFKEANTITEFVPVDTGKPWPLEKCLEEVPEIKAYAEKYPKLFQIALRLEDLPKSASQHAAGYIVSPCPVTDNIPLRRHTTGQMVSEFDMTSLEAIGALKLDLLALKNISIIHDTIKATGMTMEQLYSMDFSDPEVFKLFTSGDTCGIFQCASSGMTDIFTNILPEKMNFNVLVDVISIYRPGPLAFKDTYIRRVNGYEYPTYDIPQLEPILKDTYGIILYQEQCMRIGTDLAGYSKAQSDALRKAIAKKKGLEQELKRLVYGSENDNIPGLIKNGISEDKALKLAHDMEEFGNYAFNRSHAVGYAVLAYVTAWLKKYYTKEFLAASLTYESDKDARIEFINDCKVHGIHVLPPDINKSKAGFCVEGDSIRFGLSAIEGLGDKVVEQILANQPYNSIDDLVAKIPARHLNKVRLKSLIYSGCLDGFMDRLSAVEYINVKYRSKDPIDVVDDLAEAEKEMLGQYITSHPLQGLAVPINWNKLLPESVFTIVCLVKTVRDYITKKGDPMAFVTVETLDGEQDFVIFSKPNIQPGLIYTMQVKYSFRNGRKSFVIQEAIPVA